MLLRESLGVGRRRGGTYTTCCVCFLVLAKYKTLHVLHQM